MVDVIVHIAAGEVEVETKAGRVQAGELVDRVNRTTDSAHSFKAKLKKGPGRKKR